jgi:hypothetical protein
MEFEVYDGLCPNMFNCHVFSKKWHILMEHGWYTANKLTSSQVGWWSTQIFSHWQGLKWFNLHFSWLSLHMLWLFNVLSFRRHHIISSCPLGLSCFTHHYHRLIMALWAQKWVHSIWPFLSARGPPKGLTLVQGDWCFSELLAIKIGILP